MNVVQTNSFNRAVKKLYKNQKQDLDEAVKVLMNDPAIGDVKVGDLAGICIYKFKMVKQSALLAYHYEDQTITLTLLALGSHKNFHRDLKKSL